MTRQSGPAAALLALPLALAAGLVDGVTFLRHGVFVANLTGTVVLLGIAAARRTWAPMLPALCAIAAFIAGVTVARLLRRRTSPAAPLALSAGAVLATELFATPAVGTIAGLAAAMGLQAGSVTRFADIKLSTAFVTGDMATLAEAVAAAVWREKPQAGRPVPLVAGIVVCYGAGAWAGTLLLHATRWPLVFAAALLLAVAGLSLRAGDARAG